MKQLIIWLITITFLTLFLNGDEETNQEVNSLSDFYIREAGTAIPEQVKTGYESITAYDAQAYIDFLASDLLEGRDTASDSLEIAAGYTASLLRLWKVKPAGDFPIRRHRNIFKRLKEKPKKLKRERTFFQRVIMKELLDYDQSITIGYQKGSINRSRTFYSEVDYEKSYFYIYSDKTEEISTPVVFVGYGISEKSLGLDEYKGVDVKGKIVLMLSGLPWDDREDSPLKKGKLKEKYYPTPEQFRKNGFVTPQVKLATEKGAVAIFMIDSSGLSYAKQITEYKLDKKIVLNGAKYIDLFQDTSKYSDEKIPTVQIPLHMTDFIFENLGKSITPTIMKNKIESRRIPQSQELPGVNITINHHSKSQLLTCRNVLGFIEGRDQELKKEVVIIGAHLDHLGKNEHYIFNGANDNASGSVALLEIAQAFAVNPVKPKRSVLFALWTGEERGMIGSNFYVHSPYFPIEKTCAYINMDMIGWEWENKQIMKQFLELNEIIIPDNILGKIDIAKFLALSMSDTSGNLYNALKESSSIEGISVYLVNRKDNITTADCAPFFRKQIPSVHIASGYCEKYHRPEDDSEYIDFDLLERIARLVYLSAYNLADR